MIQRIQSVWLLLAAVCAFLTIKFSYYYGTDIKGIHDQKLNALTGGFLILATTIIIGLLALAIIFLFKDRVLQLRLCVLGILLEALLIFLYYREVKSGFTQGEYSITALLHSVIVLLFVLAARYIRQDQNLIKDSDRLR